MNLTHYKWKWGVLVLVATLAFNSCSKQKPPEPIAIEKEIDKSNLEEYIKNLDSYIIPIDQQISKQELKKKIVDLTIHRTKKEIEAILKQKEFKFYDPLSEIDNLKEKLLRSYKETDNITRLFAVSPSARKFIKIRNEFNGIQNQVLEQIYQDATAGTINQLTDTTLGTYYIKIAGYKKLIDINKDFYNLSMEYLNKIDKSGIEKKKTEERKTLTELLFKSEEEYLRNIYLNHTKSKI